MSLQADHHHHGGINDSDDNDDDEFNILEEVVAPRIVSSAPVIGSENDEEKMVKDLLETKKMAGKKLMTGTIGTTASAVSNKNTPALQYPLLEGKQTTTGKSHHQNVIVGATPTTNPQKQHGDLAAVGVPAKDGGSSSNQQTAGTTATARRQQQQQHPGAYAMSVAGGGEPTDAAANNNPHSSSSSAAAAAPTLPTDILSQESVANNNNNNNNNHLAEANNDDAAGMVPVANLVVDNNDNLPRARPEMPQDLEGGGNCTHDNNTSTSTTNDTAKTRKRNIFFAVIGSLVLGLILLAILWPGGEKSSKEQTNGDSNANDSSSSEIDHDNNVTLGSSGLGPQESSPPLSTRDYLLSLLPAETVALIKNDNTSSQALAFEWLLKDQTTTDDSNNEEDSMLVVPAYRVRQRYALAALYYSTSGDGWLKNTYWLNHEIHECDWYFGPYFGMNNILNDYIERYQEGLFPLSYPPLRCDVKGRYQHLWLSQNKLQGTIPGEIYWMLPSLKTIDWSFNAVEGTISTNIGLLTNLEGFFTFGQINGGAIPSEIGQLTLLKFMGLMQNEHTGAIPSELWQLTNLETICLNFNPQLTGTIPSEIGTFSNLRHALFHFTGLSGTIPTEIGQAKSIEWLVFIGNSMNGTLPSQIGLLDKMLHVDIGSTAITGTIPTEIGAWKSVGTIILDSNLLDGTIPQQLEELTKLSLTLDLHNNFLSGTIPTSLGLSTSLRELSLRNNNFVGPIPSEIGNIQTLEMLSLANNSLTGEVPVQLSEQLHNSLYKIQLDGNPLLSGIIPENLCNVRGICTENAVNPCEINNVGLSFDCTNLLCGCSCPCEGFSKQNNNEGA